MTGTGCYNSTFDRATNKSHVANNVKEFMARRFVCPLQRTVRNEAKLGGIAMRYLHFIGNLVKTLLTNLLFVNNYGIVKIASLYESRLKQRFHLTHENKCAGRGNFFDKIGKTVKSCELT